MLALLQIDDERVALIYGPASPCKSARKQQEQEQARSENIGGFRSAKAHLFAERKATLCGSPWLAAPHVEFSHVHRSSFGSITAN
jgi:hypothetical protein